MFNYDQILQQYAGYAGISVQQLLKLQNVTYEQAIDQIKKRVEIELENQTAQQTAAYWAKRTQQEINNQKHQQYGCIVAVDLKGAFSKDGKIPWDYKEDLIWFKNHTIDNICVVGRQTYEDLNDRIKEKGKTDVLPRRKTFVVTTSELPRNNAIAVKSIGEIDKHLTDSDLDKTIWFCGGERIYREGIAKSNTLHITVINDIVDGDRHFPTKYTMKNFNLSAQFKHDNQPNLHFTTWTRK